MKATRSFVYQKFNEYNNLMFGGRLPEVDVQLCDVKTFLGQLHYITRHDKSGRETNTDFSLKISTRYDLNQTELEDVIIHEMIHYFIALHQLVDTSTHGNIFRSIMHSINTTHHRNITITHQFENPEAALASNTKRTWHVIAIITINENNRNRKFVKVLPRVAQRVVDFYHKLNSATNVTNIDLYLHDDPYFNAYPTSTSLKVSHITDQEIADHLHGAHRLTVQGTKLIQS